MTEVPLLSAIVTALGGTPVGTTEVPLLKQILEQTIANGSGSSGTTVGEAFLNLTNPSAVTFPRINANNTVTALSAAELTAALASAPLVGVPIIVSVKDVAVLTAGAPADIATITLPASLTRWGLLGLSGNVNRVIAESAVGTLASASFTCYTAAGGGGTLLLAANFLGPSAAGVGVAFAGATVASVPFATSSTIVIRQTVNSANAGVVSFYLTVVPLL